MDLLERLAHELAKFSKVRGAMPAGANETLLRDAHDEIVRLRAEAAREWTSVKDRLPPDFEEVLLEHIMDDHQHTIDIAWHKKGDWSFPWIGRLSKAECAPVWPVRWMPLPKLPSCSTSNRSGDTRNDE